MQGETARRGFGVVEILAVILILGVLGGVLVYGSGTLQKKMRDSQRVRLMERIAVGLEAYREKNRNYPMVGDPIPGGSVVSANNSFNGLITVLGQGGFIDPKDLVDPEFGPLFGDFNGADFYEEGAKFLTLKRGCQGIQVDALVNSTEAVSYSYYTLDKKSYVMCLLTESGGTKIFVSPKESYLF